MELLNLIREKRGIIMKNNIPKGWKPLRVVIKSIRKEKLLDISKTDVKREGYKNCVEFVETFVGLNAKHLPKEIKKLNGMIYPSLKKLELWNPFVWVLEFEVKKEND